MGQQTSWTEYRDRVCYPVERYLLGYAVWDKERLFSAIMSRAFANEPGELGQFPKIPIDTGLGTKGDFVLDFAIFHKFAEKAGTPKEINHLREFYGQNKVLHAFSKNILRLQNFILWGDDEQKRKVWDESGEVLAEYFEKLIAVIYLEQGIDAVTEFLDTYHFFGEIEKIRAAGA